MGSCLKQMYRYVHIYRCRQYLEAMKQITMLHTVIMSTAVYSHQEVRSLINLLYLVSPMKDLKESDRYWDTKFY